MIITIDIGNTTVAISGLERKGFLNYKKIFSFKLETNRELTKEDYGQLVKEQFNVPKEQIQGIAISSVVPGITEIMKEIFSKLCEKTPWVVTSACELNMNLLVDEPERVGVDRLCDAAFASASENGLVITVDLGTATTMNVVDEDGNFLGGTIMPGLRTGFHALAGKAAQLYDINLVTPDHFIGKNTSDCMNIGVVTGMAGAIDAMVSQMEKQLGKSAKVFLTGGCAGVVSPLVNHEHCYDEDLLAKGLAYLFEVNDRISQANQMRHDWGIGDGKRDEGIVEPEGLIIVEDICYTDSKYANGSVRNNAKDSEINTAKGEINRYDDEQAKWNFMDLYYPENMKDDKKKPVIVSMHGGGWFYGDKQLYRPYTKLLASKGFAVVNFNYHLSPKFKYPYGFLEACKVMDYLNKHQEEYGLDMDRLYMVGDSAGAQLVSQYCIFAGNDSYRKNFFEKLRQNTVTKNVKFYSNCGLEHLMELEKENFILPKKIALNCGIYDGQHILNNDALMCEMYLPEKENDFVKETFLDILSNLDQSFPPTYMMTSINDGLRHHTAPMKARLEEVGTSLIYKEFGHEDINDSHVFHLNHRSEAGRRCNDEEIEFFKA